MKKTIVSFFILILMLIISPSGLADNIADSSDIRMPSIDAALRIKPETEEILEDGSVQQTYENISEEDFNSFLNYADQNGCSLANYTVKGSLFDGCFLKNGKTFSLTYDLSSESVIAVYPNGTKAETGVYHKIGDHVFFGHYEQDNDTSNGTEEIEWIVLNVNEDSMFLISKYVLDCQAYNENYKSVTWNTCSLRKWLNNYFVTNAFDENELSMIVPYDKTQDSVFLISAAEAKEYFSGDSDRQCEATAYAKTQGTYSVTGNGNCWWWLRSPDSSNNAAIVFRNGSCSYPGNLVSDDRVGVRPALWVELE